MVRRRHTPDSEQHFGLESGLLCYVTVFMPDAAPSPEPFFKAFGLLSHLYLTPVLRALIEGRVPDHLDAGALPASELAKRTGLHALTLTRSNIGIAVLDMMMLLISARRASAPWPSTANCFARREWSTPVWSTSSAFSIVEARPV